MYLFSCFYLFWRRAAQKGHTSPQVADPCSTIFGQSRLQSQSHFASTTGPSVVTYKVRRTRFTCTFGYEIVRKLEFIKFTFTRKNQKLAAQTKQP